MTHADIFAQLKETLKKSYSPYSKIKVASAIVFEAEGEQKVVFGTNVENASYGLTNCAERSAIFSSILLGLKDIDEVHIISNLENPIMPCGACRQVIAEFSSSYDETLVYCYNEEGDVKQFTLNQLLPSAFDEIKGKPIS